MRQSNDSLMWQLSQQAQSDYISSYAGNPDEALINIAQIYQPKYDEALKQENDLNWKLKDLFNNARESDRENVSRMIAGVEQNMKARALKPGRGFTIADIERDATEFMANSKPIMADFAKEQEDINAVLNNQTFSEEERASRIAHIKARKGGGFDDMGSYRAGYSNRIFADKADVYKKIDETMQNLQASGGGSTTGGFAMVGDDGLIHAPDGKTYRNAQGLPSGSMVETTNGTEWVGVGKDRMQSIIDGRLKGDPEIRAFVQDEVEMRGGNNMNAAERAALEKQVYDNLTGDAVKYGMSKGVYSRSNSTNISRFNIGLAAIKAKKEEETVDPKSSTRWGKATNNNVYYTPNPVASAVDGEGNIKTQAVLKDKTGKEVDADTALKWLESQKYLQNDPRFAQVDKSNAVELMAKAVAESNTAKATLAAASRTTYNPEFFVQQKKQDESAVNQEMFKIAKSMNVEIPNTQDPETIRLWRKNMNALLQARNEKVKMASPLKSNIISAKDEKGEILPGGALPGDIDDQLLTIPVSKLKDRNGNEVSVGGSNETYSSLMEKVNSFGEGAEVILHRGGETHVNPMGVHGAPHYSLTVMDGKNSLGTITLYGQPDLEAKSDPMNEAYQKLSELFYSGQAITEDKPAHLVFEDNGQPLEVLAYTPIQRKDKNKPFTVDNISEIQDLVITPLDKDRKPITRMVKGKEETYQISVEEFTRMLNKGKGLINYIGSNED